MKFNERATEERACGPRDSRVSRIFCSIGLFALISLFSLPAFPQNAKSSASTCRVGVSAAAFGFWTWASDTRVKVYILASDFKGEEIPYLLTPLRNWSAVWESAGSGVRLNYEGTTSAPLHCQNCLTIMRGPIFNRKTRHGSEFEANSEQGTQIVTYAVILIDPALTNPKALTNAVAHELGHSFGLLDFYFCKDRTTVMNKLKRMNSSNDMEGPTLCDIAQVRDAYKELRIRVGLAPLEMNGPAEVGEEPVEHDTPMVVPKLIATSKVVAILLAFHDGNEHSLTEIARLAWLSRPLSLRFPISAPTCTWQVPY